jgi:uncharacterized membrane protein
MTSMELGNGESMLETIISYILIVGVVASLILEVIGISLYYGAYGNLLVSQNSAVFISGADFFTFIANQTHNLLGSHNALLFMTLGLIILILTPYIRAVTSVVYFGWERNKKYLLITLFVLVVLTLSLALH